MRRVLALLTTTILCASCTPPDREVGVEPYIVLTSRELADLIDTLRGPANVRLGPGDYDLGRVAFTDSTCASCDDPTEDVSATRGMLVRGRGIHLQGASAEEVVLHSGAGYGVLFDGCDDCSLSDVTVADGVRDRDPRASDAGIVVRGGEVRLERCAVKDNRGDSAVVRTVVAGVAGIVVRDGGTATVRECRIEANSGDGIAVYPGGRLLALDNVVDGVDRAESPWIGTGWGTGILLRGDAKGILRGNLVTRFTNGVGVLGNAQSEVSGNVIEDIAGWGIAYEGTDDERPVGWIRGNAIFETGACGIVIDRTAAHGPEVASEPGDGFDALADDGPGEVAGNVLMRTNQDERKDSGGPCAPRPIAIRNLPDGFRVADNLIHDVRQPGSGPTEPVLDAEGLRAAAADLLARLATSSALQGSRFLGLFQGSGPR